MGQQSADRDGRRIVDTFSGGKGGDYGEVYIQQCMLNDETATTMSIRGKYIPNIIYSQIEPSDLLLKAIK